MDFIIILTISLFAISFGSFANVLLYRTKHNKSIVFGRSFCPKCNHNLNFIDLFPVFSFIFQKGKCRYCKKKISYIYPLIEISFLVLGLSLYFYLLNFSSFNWLNFILLFFLFSFFWLIFLYDTWYQEIPDSFSIPALFLALTYTYFNTNNFYSHLLAIFLVYTFFYLQIFIPSFIYYFKQKKTSKIFISLLEYIIFPIWLLTYWIHPKINKVFEKFEETEEIPAWIGGGDLRLAFIIGSFLDLKKTIIALFIAYLTGSLISIFILLKTKKRIIAFGPFLVTGILISFFWGEQIFDWYFNFL
jgi:leader peptidase (prepilin peptidase)/N-methyltransferase